MRQEDRCTKPASMRRFWPGKGPDYVCIDHAQDTAKIGQMLGYIHLEPMDEGEEEPCACSKGRLGGSRDASEEK